MKKKELAYDVVIVGAGIVGLTLACSLIDKGLRIAIVDRDTGPIEGERAFCIESELRVSAITQGSRQALETLKVWQRLIGEQAAFRCMQIWEPVKGTPLFFDSAACGQPSLGYIVRNQDLQTALFQQVKTDEKLDWFFEEALSDIALENDHALLVLASGLKIATKLVVGADGADSSVRQLSGIQTQTKDYRQQAVVATVQTELAHAQTARQVFLPSGPLAFLPLTHSHFSSIVWSTSPEAAQRLMTCSDTSFCLELESACDRYLGRVESTSSRLSFPLRSHQCEHIIKPSLALIGDAAHTVHPLAGQGANLGIADALCLAKVILDAGHKRRALGALYSLRPYERERCFHHRVMGSSIDGIKHLLATSHPFLQKACRFGLRFINKTPRLKRYVASYAMGNPVIDLLK